MISFQQKTTVTMMLLEEEVITALKEVHAEIPIFMEISFQMYGMMQLRLRGQT